MLMLIEMCVLLAIIAAMRRYPPCVPHRYARVWADVRAAPGVLLDRDERDGEEDREDHPHCQRGSVKRKLMERHSGKVIIGQDGKLSESSLGKVGSNLRTCIIVPRRYSAGRHHGHSNHNVTV